MVGGLIAPEFADVVPESVVSTAMVNYLYADVR